MSNTYLDKFRSTLPSSQGNQILRLLTSKRDSGEIKNVDEFKAKLQELTEELITERITPTFKLIEALPGQDISSEEYNEMIARIQDDLETAFTEADNIDEIITAHDNLINQVALKTLKTGIDELESRIQLYEFINKDTLGFNDAVFNTFRESLNNITSRADQNASLLYSDPVTSEVIDNEQDADLDIIGERLILAPTNKQFLDIKEAVWLSNSNSIRSELDVAFENSDISNLIDNENNTFWVESILLTNIRTTGVPMEICLKVEGGARDVNFVEIEPATKKKMFLTGIDYFDSNNTRQTASSEQVLLSGPTRVNFDRVNAKGVIVKVRQDNYKETQFKKKLGESNFHKAVLQQSSNDINLDSVSDDLNDLLSSEFILNSVFGIQDTNLPELKYYEYLLGFDNIRLGFSKFEERSIYVSSVKRVDNPGNLGLKVDEVRPVQVSETNIISLETFKYPTRITAEDEKFYHGSIEYWFTVLFFSPDNFLISTDTIPVLPLGAKRIYHDRLLFTAKTEFASNNNVAQLRFFTDADSSDVLVYKNGTLLTYGSLNDWDFVADDGNLTIETPNSGRPMKRAISISQEVNSLDIYTVSYTPKTSNSITPSSQSTLVSTVDLVGDNTVRLTSDNCIVIDKQRLSYNVAYAHLYLSIIKRRNSAIEHFSPALEEYLIATGSRDSQRFISE